MVQAGKSVNAELLGKRLGERIAFHRKKRGLTQGVLAEKLDVEDETISRFERGSVLPSLVRLFEIAEVLEIGVGALLSEASPLPKDVVGGILSTCKDLHQNDLTLLLDFANLLKGRTQA